MDNINVCYEHIHADVTVGFCLQRHVTLYSRGHDGDEERR